MGFPASTTTDAGDRSIHGCGRWLGVGRRYGFDVQDVRLLRVNPERVRAAVASRGDDTAPLAEALDLDVRRRHLLARRDELRHEVEQLSAEIGRLYRDGRRDEASESIERSRMLVTRPGRWPPRPTSWAGASSERAPSAARWPHRRRRGPPLPQTDQQFTDTRRVLLHRGLPPNRCTSNPILEAPIRATADPMPAQNRRAALER